MTRRLLASYLAVTVIVLLVLEIPFGALVADRQRAGLVTGLERDALILATIYVDALHDNAPYSPGPAFDYAASGPTRVVVVDLAGKSIVDTERGANEDFTNRDEIVQALSGRLVSGRRRSETLGRDLLYVAVPVASGGEVSGAVRITADPADVETLIHRFWWTLAGVAAVGWVIAMSIARPITAVRDAAIRAREGDLDISIDPGDAPGELSDLVARFNEMAHRLREVIERQQAFVGDASHQLRTPLTALTLRLEGMEEALTGPEQADAAAALSEVHRLGRLVDQLLALARMDGKAPTPEAIDLAVAAEARCELWRPTAEERDIAIVSEGTGTPAMATVLPGAVDQILDNLIDNALAASPDHSEVEIRLVTGSDHHTLHVVDSGEGMDDAQRGRAFERFWRGDMSRDGTGLGLAIVQRLAESSGGSAELGEAAGGGLDAMVTFPVAGGPGIA